MQPTTRTLTHSALMLALALLLSMIKFYHFPNGGSITAASMAPIIIISLMYDTRWALFTPSPIRCSRSVSYTHLTLPTIYSV